MILKPNQTNGQRRNSILIEGVPGIGKSTLALSAPDPLSIITDPGGWDRIPAHCRKGDRIEPGSYDEILSDLTPDNVAPYQTICIDTGGSLITLMKNWAIKRDPKNGQKDGTTLSIRGYGAVRDEFARLVILVREQFRKHLVITFHVKEDRDGEATVYRLDCEGGTRNDIWKPMDLGGFMETSSNRRTIGFSPTDRYYAKGTHGITGILEVPDVMSGKPNDFLTNLFARINQNIAQEAEMNGQYEEVVNRIRTIIDGVTDAKTATSAGDEIKGMAHVYGSLMEARHMMGEKVKALGLVLDKSKGVYVNPKSEIVPEPGMSVGTCETELF